MARTLRAEFMPFVERMNSLLHATLTNHPLQPAPTLGNAGVRAFHFGGGDHVAQVRSAAFGDLWLFIGQRMALGEDGELVTLEYSYGLAPTGQRDATFRWDYAKRRPAEKLYCRHHLQGSHTMALGAGTFRLDDLHMPTGYVSIEDIIRFCIHDLGAMPRSEDWDARLLESSAAFRARLAQG